MKFPLADHPFRTLQLTPEQCHEYEHVATTLVDDTIAAYERFVHLENRTLDKKRWKAVKTRENLTVYKQMDRTTTKFQSASSLRAPTLAMGGSPQSMASFSSSSTAASNHAASTVLTNMNEWKLPKLLAVGSIVGTLDDVMYGVMAPDVKAMLLRSSYVSDELVDGGVLFQMKSATREDPFQFLGIKWYVKAHPAAINAVVSPRDSVVIDATGLRFLENGDRIGYHIFHSVEVPECPELSHLSILRGHLSSCYLFKQLRNGTVEVYMTTFVNPGGRLTESLATMSVANALVGCHKSVWCAQGKKLAYVIRKNARKRLPGSSKKQQQDTMASTASSSSKGSGCELCGCAFKAFKTARGCQVCLKLVCSKCQCVRKISHIQRGLQVKQTAVVVCSECVAHVAQVSALDIAREEFVGKQVFQHSLMTDKHVMATSIGSDGDNWSDTSSTMGGANAIAETPTMASSYGGHYGLQYGSSGGGYASSSSHDGSFSPPTAISLYGPTHTTSMTGSSLGSNSSHDSHQKQLLMQMNQLCMAAEQTYMVAKQNTTALRFSPLE